MGKTFGTLAVFIVVAILPKVPWWAKLLIQVVIGMVVYLAMAETDFPLPSPDTNPIGASLYGGNIEKAWGMDTAPAVAYLSMGVIGTVLGVLSTLVVTAGQAIFKKKSD